MRWSGPFHVVNRQTRTSLESYRTEWAADAACDAENLHQRNNHRPELFGVEEHPQEWRGDVTEEEEP